MELIREPDNPHDKNAIAVFLKLGRLLEIGQVGYIGREDAALLAVLMDSGSKLVAYAEDVGLYEGKYYLHISVSEVENETTT